MNMTEAEYRQLKAEFDADAKAEIERVELERVQNHQALDRLWARIQHRARSESASSGPVGVGSPTGSLFTPTSVSASSNGNGSGPRAPFAMKDAVRRICVELGRDEEITQPVVYKLIIQRYRDQVGWRKQQHVRGQITGILTKFTEGESPFLIAVKEAEGSEPKVFMLNHVEVG